MLFRKSRRTVHEDLQLDDPQDPIEITDSSIQSANEIDCHSPGGLFSLLSCDVQSKLARPRSSIPPGNVAGDKHQAAHTCKGQERRDRRCHLRELNFQSRQLTRSEEHTSEL